MRRSPKRILKMKPMLRTTVILNMTTQHMGIAAGDVDAVANNVDQGEVLDVEKGGQRAGIVKSMVQNSEDNEITVTGSQMDLRW